MVMVATGTVMVVNTTVVPGIAAAVGMPLGDIIVVDMVEVGTTSRFAPVKMLRHGNANRLPPTRNTSCPMMLMLAASKPLAVFIERHPTVKMLASFTTRSSLSRIAIYYWCRLSTKPPRPSMGTCTLLALAVHLTVESRDAARLNLRQGGFGTG